MRIKRQIKTTSFAITLLWIALPIGCLALIGHSSSLQRVLAFDEPTAEQQLKEQNEQKYADGGIVVTRPELEELLRRAELFAADSSFRNATTLWTKVLEEGNSALVSTDAETYVPLADRVETAIAALPPAGLQAYRIVADGEAQALLAQSDRIGREAALSSVVEQHFMSSIGDQAAFELAGILIDRYDMVGAARLINRIETRHPDADVSASELQLRKAVVLSSLGDSKGGREAFQVALRSQPALAPELLNAVDRYLQQTVSAETFLTQDVPWGVPFGNARRNGRMPGLPPEYLSSDLMVVGSYELDSSVRTDQIDGMLRNFGGTTQEPTNPLESALSRGAQFNWLPVQQALVGPDGILVKSSSSPMFLRADEAGVISAGWKSAWNNLFLIDDATIAERINMAMYGSAPGGRGGPTHVTEVFLYGDQVHQSMAIIGDTAYVIEGQPYPEKANLRNDNLVNQGAFGIQSIRRARTNWLTAYDVRNGKLRWTRAAFDPDFMSGGAGAMVPDPGVGLMIPQLAPVDAAPAVEAQDPNIAVQQVPDATGVPNPQEQPNRIGLGADGLPLVSGNNGVMIVTNGAGYLGSPVSSGDLLILPMTDGGSIHLQAISKLDGRTVWRSQLCDAPSNGAPKWTPVHLALDGKDLYCTCGVGLLFSVSASDGRIRFARRYVRDTEGGPNANSPNPFGGQMPVSAVFKGWLDDLVVPFQGVVVVAASDSDRLQAFDRTTGAFVWSAPRSPFTDPMTYVVGVRGRYLYAAGRQSILCYDLQGQGRLVWREEFEQDSMGRACLTESGIYVPAANSVIHYAFDPPAGQRGRKVTQVGVRGLQDRSVGNLYSDGRRLWSVVAGRVYALDSASTHLNELERRSESGDPAALWERTRLAIEAGERGETLELLEQILNTAPTHDASQLTASTSTEESVEFQEVRESIRSLNWLDSVADDPQRLGAGFAFWSRLAVQDQGSGTWIDWQQATRRRELLAELLAASNQPFSETDSRAWSPLITHLDDRAERTEWANRLSPVNRRDAAIHMLGRTEPGNLLLGLTWVDAAGAEQARERLEDLAIETEMHETVRADAIEQLFRLHSIKSPEAVAAALKEFQNASLRSRVAKSWEMATGEPIEFDALGSAESRAEQVARWQAQRTASGHAISWKTLESNRRDRFDRLVAGFPNSGELIEFTLDGRSVRKHDCDGLVAATADLAGNRWIAFPNRLEHRTPENEVIGLWELNGYPKGIATFGSDEIWVALDGVPGTISVLRDAQASFEQIETSGEAIDAICPWDRDSFLVSVRVSGQLQRWSRDGERIEDLRGQNISGMTRTDEGNLLAASSLNAEVQEFNGEKRTISRHTNLPQARACVRTSTGLTVVAYSQGLVALDRDGNEVWAVRDRGPAITLAYF